MKKSVLILGASGMLGVEVLRELSKKNITIYATVRDLKDKTLIQRHLNEKLTKIKWIKFKIDNKYLINLKKIVKNKNYIINCIGTIKPYINEQIPESIKNALTVNSIFPHDLNKLSNKNTKIFQIATDCVYDGAVGQYNEFFSHNATDVYGKSKSIGEVKSQNFFNIRCSIIGKELKNYKSLLCWFLMQKENSKISGFKNHLWNGITTRHFAKIISILIEKNIKIPNFIHIIPSQPIDKYSLLKVFQKRFKRNDLIIKKVDAKIIVNRTLSSINSKTNKDINRNLGYKKTPTIEQMVNEII